VYIYFNQTIKLYVGAVLTKKQVAIQFILVVTARIATEHIVFAR